MFFSGVWAETVYMISLWEDVLCTVTCKSVVVVCKATVPKVANKLIQT